MAFNASQAVLGQVLACLTWGLTLFALFGGRGNGDRGTLAVALGLRGEEEDLRVAHIGSIAAETGILRRASVAWALAAQALGRSLVKVGASWAFTIALKGTWVGVGRQRHDCWVADSA